MRSHAACDAAIEEGYSAIKPEESTAEAVKFTPVSEALVIVTVFDPGLKV